ncbi:MAG: hypothetical protein A3F25_00120 [Candidatus Yanofskybacteria bacterium RIFCSPHIGHO2_12_FULL_45_19b]|uniref:methylated-DNA--[protein]-cysteine S-methyltransferase n=1 Tax=Candidatus Yanofskybacteria bacterium RIFCSPHIGHO2_12_FULL_45_19b TaxID=1802689 RepID=A0A1F8G0J4_9BACT|nr:MAG: hypothetical protein A3F25_00120 [Candidatus Yanofskybacteria bacterium RIFCSPHIGHO2_12_FULL_45_19b]
MTDFQKQVYAIVAKIKSGQTATYAEIAQQIGRPRAYRAVGNALNKNPFMGTVPCHRVIKSNGEIGGYAKGTKAKQRLLKKEGAKTMAND